ncbi:hypothetical protein Tco_1290198 [Tanacetum coccineum]
MVLQEDLSCNTPISDIIDAESIPETTHIKDAQKESSKDVLMSTNDRETTKEVVYELVSRDKSIINREHKDGNERMKLATSSEASNGSTELRVPEVRQQKSSILLTTSTLRSSETRRDLEFPFDEI